MRAYDFLDILLGSNTKTIEMRWINSDARDIAAAACS